MDRVLGGSEYEHRAAVERSRASARASLEADGQRGILEDYHPEDVRPRTHQRHAGSGLPGEFVPTITPPEARPCWASCAPEYLRAATVFLLLLVVTAFGGVTRSPTVMAAVLGSSAALENETRAGLLKDLEPVVYVEIGVYAMAAVVVYVALVAVLCDCLRVLKWMPWLLCGTMAVVVFSTLLPFFVDQKAYVEEQVTVYSAQTAGIFVLILTVVIEVCACQCGVWEVRRYQRYSCEAELARLRATIGSDASTVVETDPLLTAPNWRLYASTFADEDGWRSGSYRRGPTAVPLSDTEVDTSSDGSDDGSPSVDEFSVDGDALRRPLVAAGDDDHESEARKNGRRKRQRQRPDDSRRSSVSSSGVVWVAGTNAGPASEWEDRS